MLPSRRAVGRTCVIHGFMAWRRATRVWDAFKKLSCLSKYKLSTACYRLTGGVGRAAMVETVCIRWMIAPTLRGQPLPP